MDYAGPGRELILRLFNKRIESYKSLFKVRWKKGAAGQNIVPIVFSLAPQAKELGEQGYSLDIGPEGITGRGKDNAGMVNALASLLQLMFVKDGNLVVRQAHIIDWPTFTTRYTSDYTMPGVDFLDWMMLYKINGFSGGYAYYIDWRGLTDQNRKEMGVIRDYIDRYQTLAFMPQIHIGPRVTTVRPAVDSGNPEDVKALLKTVEELLLCSGAREIMVCYDDVSPYPSRPMEKKRFKTLGQANGFVLDQLYERMQKVRPGSKLMFCPPYYQGRARHYWRKDSPIHQDAMQYMKDTQSWNKNIILVWTGANTESKVIVDGGYRPLPEPDRQRPQTLLLGQYLALPSADAQLPCQVPEGFRPPLRRSHELYQHQRLYAHREILLRHRQ